jgi:hypothetical protein
VALLLDQDRLESPLENMPIAMVGAIERLSIDAVQVTHPRGEIAFRSFEQKMIVVTHEAVGVTDKVEPSHDLPEDRQNKLPIAIVREDVRPCVAPRGDMIDCAGKFYA